MGKKVKKWYVVIVGKEVGVFDSWTEAAPLISGVPGALHESFTFEEEAHQKFLQERDKGNTRVVRSRSQKVEAPSPTPTSPVSPAQKKSRTVSSGRSSPRPLVTPQSRRSPQPASPLEERAASPTILHANVTYTRGPSSSPNFSPRASRRAFPRIVVRTPPDILPFPAESVDSPSTPPSSPEDGKSEAKRGARPGSYRSSPASVSPKAALQGLTMPPLFHAVVQTPSHVNSYKTYDGQTVGDEILSPLQSPRFYTPENVSPSLRLSTRHLSTDHCCLPSASDHSRCRHTCPNCQHTSTYVTGCMLPFGFSQNLHSPREGPSAILRDDPRSPMMNAGSLLGQVSSLSFRQPSPVMEAEEQLSSLFASA